MQSFTLLGQATSSLSQKSAEQVLVQTLQCVFRWICEYSLCCAVMMNDSCVYYQVSSGLYPPMSLLDYPPLATFCNSLLTAMNDLRLCAPLSLAADVARLTNECLLRVATAIADYHRYSDSDRCLVADIFAIYFVTR